MPTFHVIVHRSGPEWNHGAPIEGQSGWEAHAAFMDGLVEQGALIMGGPLEDVRYTMHVIQAESEQGVRDLFATDPWWVNGMLRPVSIERWTILLDSRN